jgi:hypothetical protein
MSTSEEKTTLSIVLESATGVWESSSDVKVNFRIACEPSCQGEFVPSLILQRVGGESGYWAPFNPHTGLSLHPNEVVRIDAPRELAAEVDAKDVQWAPLRSSVWPNQTIFDAVPPGEYKLHLTFEPRRPSGSSKGAETRAFHSNDVSVVIQ